MVKTNAEDVITAIAKSLLDYSDMPGRDGDCAVRLAVCAARRAFEVYGIPVHINAEICVNARLYLYDYMQKRGTTS